MFALFFIIAFVTGLQNPMGVIIKSQFAASNLQSQLGNLANFIAYAFMGIPAGMMLQRMGYKKTALTAIAVGFAGVCVMWFAGRAGSYGIYLAGAFVSGFSMCMLNTVVNPMLKSLGSNEKRGNQLIQFGTTFNSLGATLTPILVGYLMGNEASARSIASANPALYTAMGIFVLAFAVIAFTRIPEPYGTAAGGRGSGRFYTPLRFRHFSLGVAAIFLYVGIEVGIPNIANLYMTDALAMDSSAAGTIVGTYWLLMLAGRLTGGAIGGRVSGRAMLTFASALGLLFIGLFIALQGVAATVPLPVFRSDLSFGAEPRPHQPALPDTLRTGDIRHVGRHLQPRHIGARRIYGGGLRHLHDDGLRRGHHACTPGMDSRPKFLSDKLCARCGRFRLPAVLCAARQPDGARHARRDTGQIKRMRHRPARNAGTSVSPTSPARQACTAPSVTGRRQLLCERARKQDVRIYGGKRQNSPKQKWCCGGKQVSPPAALRFRVLIGELVHLIVVEIIETEDEVVILFPPRFQQLRRSIRRSMVEAFLRRLDILFQFCPCTHNTRFSQRRRKKDTNLPVLLRMSDGQLPERCLRKAGHRPARRSRACLPPQKAACRQLREQGAAQSSASSSIRALR